MSSSENPVPCSNCNKLLPSHTITLHEAYCLRNFVKCCECDEMIDKTDNFSHKKTHEKVDCIHCHEQIKSLDLELHLKNCAKKPKICEFCKITYNISDFSSHQIQCGSRTQLCEICGKYVKLSEFCVHEENCLLLMSLREEDSSSKPHISSNVKKLEAIESDSGEEYLPDLEEKKSMKNDSKEYKTRNKTTSMIPVKKPNEVKERLRKPKKITSYEEKINDSDEEILFQKNSKPKLKKVKGNETGKTQEMLDSEFARSLQEKEFQEELGNGQKNMSNSQKGFAEFFKRKK